AVHGVVDDAAIEIVGAAEIVLGARTADGGKVLVAIHEELDLALAPPAGIVDAPSHVGADIVAAALDTVDDRVVGAVGERIGAAELGVEIGGVLGDVGKGIVDLVVN